MAEAMAYVEVPGYGLLIPISEVERVVNQRDRYREALETIRGPEDRGPWIDVYRKAGGGYDGLQAIAREALDG